MALSSVIKCSPSKWQKNQQKDASHLKHNKNSSHGKRYKKKNWKGGKMKNQKHKESLTT